MIGLDNWRSRMLNLFKKNKKKVALIIGHKIDAPGACNSETCEYFFNETLVYKIAKEYKGLANIEVVHRDSYKSLPRKVNNTKADLAISFHCNAYNKKTSGSEVLYYHSSQRSKKIAQIFQDGIVDILQLSDRGIKAISAEDRGGYLLKYTNMPIVLLEPFFIDNMKDYNILIDRYQEYTDKLIDCINQSLKIL